MLTGRPKPRKLSDASAMMTPPTLMLKMTPYDGAGVVPDQALIDMINVVRIPVKKATHSGNKKPPGGWSNPDTATIAGWLF